MSGDDEQSETRAMGSNDEPIAFDELLPDGFEIGNYIVDNLIGRGGFARVYEATHQELGKRVAIKVLHHEAARPVMIQRFIREAQIVTRIGHPNIIDIFDFGTLPDGRPYFVMERLEGRDLARMIRLRGRLQAAEAVELLDPVCAAIHAAHMMGVVHRDVKAPNVFVTDDEPPRIKLLDFGVAKLLWEDPVTGGLSVSGEQIGTPTIMAPEQIRGEVVTPQTDVYALGVLLFRMLTGRNPFEVSDASSRHQGRALIEAMHLSAPPPRPSQFAPVTPAVDAVVLKAMEKSAKRRHTSAQEFIVALRDAVGQQIELPRSESVARAIGVFVDVTMDESAHEDDAALADCAQLLDDGERFVFGAGLDPLLQTGNAMLAVGLLPRDFGDSLPLRERVVAAAKEIYEMKQTLDKRLRVRVLVQVTAAFVRPSGERFEIMGGPILVVDDWEMSLEAGLHVGEHVLNRQFEEF